MADLTNILFKTNAIKVCKDGNPFWLASNVPSPYFCNTENTYGSEKKAQELLHFIDKHKDDALNFPRLLMGEVEKNYETDELYATVIDELVERIRSSIDLHQVTFISGGERRDWFFSLMIARILKKPHLTIYKKEYQKDLNVVFSTPNASISFPWGKGADKFGGTLNGIHVADIITKGTSYIDSWIPSVEKCNGKIKHSVNVATRRQGGEETLSASGIQTSSLVTIDQFLFERALKLGLVTKEQYNMVFDYISSPDPDQVMNAYMDAHPDALDRALNSDDPKVKERSQIYANKRGLI